METANKTISSTFIKAVCDRLAENKRVRRQLSPWGRLHIDRQLPFLCVYRQPRGRKDPETARLIQGEASYLMAPGHRQSQEGLRLLVQRIAETMSESFGAFLILEVWSATDCGASKLAQDGPERPVFRIFAPRDRISTSTVEILEATLKRIRLGRLKAEVHSLQTGKTTPPGLSPLLSSEEARMLGCSVIGLEVKPVYREVETGQSYKVKEFTLWAEKQTKGNRSYQRMPGKAGTQEERALLPAKRNELFGNVYGFSYFDTVNCGRDYSAGVACPLSSWV